MSLLLKGKPRATAIVFLFTIVAFQIGCDSGDQIEAFDIRVYQTSQAGDNLKLLPVRDLVHSDTTSNEIALTLRPKNKFQEYIGFGASFTESSAWNLATIPVQERRNVLTKLFSPTDGAGFSLTRTHINSSDYSNGHYTYVEDGDIDLSSFSIYEDMKGFTGDENDQVKNIELVTPEYDLIPMIKEAGSIPGADFKIIASAWSPPSWMKTGETDVMTNGSLRPDYFGLWAIYLSKYVSAYKDQGIDLWGLTPQNEPLHAHDARWDSNGFTKEEGRDFLRDHLGPQLVNDGHLFLNDLDKGLHVLIYDHNKSTMLDYVKPTYLDSEAAKYAWGTGFHWYASSKLEESNWFVRDLDEHSKTWPNKGLIHTESSIDIDEKDPIGQYWRESTDYAGKFVPFDTYAFDIISDLNHGTQGYIEWCMILSHKGQPNPYDNFNSAPVLINPNTDEVTYTPLYYLLSHFSKFIRPGAERIELVGDLVEGVCYTAAINVDGSVAIVLFNSNESPYDLSISLDGIVYKSHISSRSMQTIHLIKAS